MRKRLALLAAATTLLVLVAFLVPLALLVRTVAADRAVSRATLQSQALSSVVATGDPGTLRLILEQLNNDTESPVTVFLSDGSALGEPARRTAAVELAAQGRSLAVEVPGGRQILVSVQGRAEGPAVIATFVPDEQLQRGVRRAWLILLGLGVGLVLVGVVVADRLAHTLVRPVSELASVSHRLARGDLAARARPQGPPEFRDVALALNHLAGRIRGLLREEREAVADLSHRLRTPMTALRLDAEALSDPDEAERLGADVDRLERAISQAIHDTRRRGEAGTGAAATCDATAVVAERVEFWSVLAEETDRTARVDLPAGPVPVRVAVADLAGLVDALLGNVFAHTPDGTGFAVALAARPDGGARLTIADDGPGFPANQLEQLVSRGTSLGNSTGLGLDIAVRVAEASGGGLGLSSGADGGARVTVDLGAPTDATDGPTEA
ncbi:MAG: HAMP domain-containing sensor histidine kinase [Actinocatenispora sp.]